MLNLFKNASAQLKEAFKNVSWQEKQKQSILEHKKRNIEKLEKEEKDHDLELKRLEKELEVMREEMKLLENEEMKLLENEEKDLLLENERTNFWDREFEVKSAKFNHMDQVNGVNSYESRPKMVERQRTYTGSYINSSMKKHPVSDGNMHTVAGGAMVRIGGNLHRMEEDLERKSRMAFSTGRVGHWAMASMATDEFSE